METAIVTTKGEIVIPFRIRRRHGLRKGTQVCFIEQGDDIVLRPVTDEYIDGIRGSMDTHGKVLKALLAEKKKLATSR